MTAAPRPRLLDLFCGAGGAAMGYHRAGFVSAPTTTARVAMMSVPKRPCPTPWWVKS